MKPLLAVLTLVIGLAAGLSQPLAERLSLSSRPDLGGCIPCHGADGIAREAEVPNLAGQNARYLYTQLKAFKRGTRKHPEMNYMSRTMTDADMVRLADYYAALPAR